MTYYTITADRGGLQTAQNDVVYLSSGVSMGGIDMRGYGSGGGGLSGSQSLFLYGEVFGGINDYWTDTSGGNFIQIGRQGTVGGVGWGTIQLGGGGNTIVNAGEISSSLYGNAIYVVGSVGAFRDVATTLVNSGLIVGSSRGGTNDNLVTFANIAASIEVTNSGEMNAGNNAFALSANAAEGGRVINTGLIVGDLGLYGGAYVVDTRFGQLFGEIQTGSGDDFVRGSAGDDSISASSGMDSLLGLDGDDRLDGGFGDDYMSGGNGDDTFWVNSSSDFVKESAGGGDDTVRSTITFTLGSNVESLVLLDAGPISGTGNSLDNTITGNDGANGLFGGTGDDTLVGGAGNDTLDGGSGADRMSGGAGSDTYVVDNSGDLVIETGGAGTDLVQASISHILAANVEALTLIGTAGLTGTGNSLANTLTGNSGANTLSGLIGNDSLTGGSGNDSLIGATGADSLTGGAGADRFVYTSTAESTVSTTGRDLITDFSRAEGDRINLFAIDANTASAGDQAFSATLVAAFTGVSGQLRTFVSGSDTFVQGDVNGDGTADFSIRIDPVLTLQASDFIL